jgi:hypothetical protein
MGRLEWVPTRSSANRRKSNNRRGNRIRDCWGKSFGQRDRVSWGMNDQIYVTDLTDAEWEVLRPLLEPRSRRGRPRRHPLRVVLNAIFYALRTGCA